jgi:hypothetical protein
LYVVRWLVLKRKYTEAQREVEKIARVRVLHGLNNYKDTKPRDETLLHVKLCMLNKTVCCRETELMCQHSMIWSSTER